MGKGGAGKTTVAARAALTSARSGSRTLLVSLDQAHSVADVVHTGESYERGDVVSIETDFDVLEIDTLGLVEARYRQLATILTMSSAGHEHGLRFGAVEPEEIVGAPGVQELLGLARVAELVEEGAWDVVMVDMPSTGETLRTLQMPDLVCSYFERLWPQHDRIVAGTGSDPRLTVVVAMIERVVAGADAVRTLLFDPMRTSVTLVATPDAIVIAETRRLLSVAALNGIPVDTVVMNKVLPDLDAGSTGLVGTHPAVYWFESLRSAQQVFLDDIESLTVTCDVVVVELAPTEPVGLAALGRLVWRVVSTGTAIGAVESEPVVACESGSGLESIYTMTMMLPVVDPASVNLGRVEDDLIVGADGARRRVRLASVLRRCVVVGAEYEAGRLVVRFRPDASVWPA